MSRLSPNTETIPSRHSSHQGPLRDPQRIVAAEECHRHRSDIEPDKPERDHEGIPTKPETPIRIPCASVSRKVLRDEQHSCASRPKHQPTGAAPRRPADGRAPRLPRRRCGSVSSRKFASPSMAAGTICPDRAGPLLTRTESTGTRRCRRLPARRTQAATPIATAQARFGRHSNSLERSRLDLAERRGEATHDLLRVRQTPDDDDRAGSSTSNGRRMRRIRWPGNTSNQVQSRSAASPE